jgi:ribosomal protein S18 acetylase RimI-like enzyme
VGVELLANKATVEQIAEHLGRCDAGFEPPLSSRVQLPAYAQKIASHAQRFEAWSDGTLVGLVAAYCNDTEKLRAHITSVSVLPDWMGKGIGSRLMAMCIEHATGAGMRQIDLEVAGHDPRAIKLYRNSGFVLEGATKAPFVRMTRALTAAAVP